MRPRSRNPLRKRRTRKSRSTDNAVGEYFGDAWSLAKRTASGLNEIRKLINVETKILDTSYSATAMDQSGTVQSLSTIVQGLDYNQRLGDSIKLQHIRFAFWIRVSAASISSACRVIVFRDLFQQGTAPTVTQVIQNNGADDVCLQPRNWLLKDRFSVLHDETYELSNAGDTNYSVTLDIPHGGHVKYLGTTAAAASNGFGSLYVLYASTEATNKPTVQHFCRITFTDD